MFMLFSLAVLVVVGLVVSWCFFLLFSIAVDRSSSFHCMELLQLLSANGLGFLNPKP